MRRLMLACSLLLCACTDDSSSTGMAAFGEACTTVSNTSTECQSGVCTDSFDMIGHPVCSQLCTAGMNDSCPVGTSGMKFCNMKGFCKP
ncbi:MAG TPA: hypothetical protein VFT22_33665 [Kofleriaceae bacterium]|nr:hypothetical protein [Kofleriaceae bacterium]